MLTVLFWNTGGKPLAERVAGLVHQHGVDLVVLAECGQLTPTVSALNRRNPTRPFEAVETESRVAVVAGFLPALLTRIRGTAYHTVFALRAVEPVRPPLLIAVAHLPSQLRTSDAVRQADAAHLAADLVAAEDEVGHQNTFVIGDLNADPFEPGVAEVLNGVMTRRLAARPDRMRHGRRSRHLYNPMWQFFGDDTLGPPGTYYYGKAGDCCHWHLFDQVLLRPSLLSHFPADGVMILKGDEAGSFLGRSGRPDRNRASDHLPVLVRLVPRPEER